MKRHMLLTGEIQIGKSTAIRRFLENSGIRADGFVTRFNSRGQKRELYISRFDTVNGESDIALAVRMDKHEIIKEAFENHGSSIIRTSGQRELIIMDELGVFEECAPAFKEAVFEKLDGEIRVLGVVKKKTSQFLDEVRAHPKVTVFEVTEENRVYVPKVIESWFEK